MSESFPNGEFAHFFQADWLTQMARDIRGNKENTQRTQDTARWARDQIKRQCGKFDELAVASAYRLHNILTQHKY